MRTLRLVVNKDYPEPRKIQRAVETLERGGVIAYPTDTTYGIGCSIFDKKAIDRIYLLKGLKRDHLLSSMIVRRLSRPRTNSQ